MLLVGLTGGIASGKTLVTDTFDELGASIIDADLLAREVVLPGSPGLNKLIDHFTTVILTPQGELDRAALRRIVFANPADREFLDSTLHPLIRQLSNERLDEAAQQNQPYAIYAVPLLFETDQRSRFDRVAVVDVPVSMQIERLMARDSSTEQEARSIVKAQASRDERLSIADDVIDNTGTVEETRARVKKLHEAYLKLSESKE